MSRMITGAGGGGKGGGGSSRVAVEARDSLRSKAYARVLDAVSEGEIEGLVDGLKSIYLDGTPIQNADNSYNFSGVEMANRTGTQAQAYLPGFPSVESTQSVAVEVTTAVSVTRQISNSSTNALRVTIGVPQLTFQNTTNGDLSGTSVRYAIDLQSNGGGFIEKVNETITGKTTTRYQRSHRIELTGSPPWDIRVRRITADSVSASLQNKTWWDTYTEIIDAKLRYPNTALVGLKVDSSQFQSIPTRGYDMKMLRVKVPSNYNATTRVYTGSWDGNFIVAWTDNPAWCFYDLVTNDRYGLGGIVDEALVDKWALYTIGRYCDELVSDGFGGTEPRFTCNFYLQTRQEAFKVLRDFASIFRGMVYWSSGSITATQDSPSDPVALYAAANVVDGRFTYAGSSLKARHTVALVTWNDPADVFAQKIEYVEDTAGIARYGVQQTEIVAVGCTSRGQANRAGRWLLFSERLETETVQFSIGLDGAMVRPGHIIKVADANRASARLGGRVSASTVNNITVDSAPALTIAGWTLYCTLADGTVQSRIVASLTGSVIAVSVPFTSAPTPQGIWVLSGPSVQAQTFRVIAVTEDAETGQFGVSALVHEVDKYAAVEDGLVLQPRDITLLNDLPGTPTGLAVSESLYTYQSEVRAKLNLGWLAVAGAYKYAVEWRKDSGNWARAETQTAEFELLDITPGLFEFKVYARNAAGLTSGTAGTASITALGKTAPPANVTGFTSLTDPNIGVTLSWARVADLDLDSYEVRDGATWAGSALVGQVKGTTLKVGALTAGTKTYLVKALDTSGTYSTTAASTSVTITAPPAPAPAAALSVDAYVLTWAAVTGSLATQSYTVRYGASYAAGVTVATFNGTRLAVPINWVGARTFWVAATDVAGTTGAAGSTAVTVTLAGAPTVTHAFAGENVVLTWTAVQGTLPTIEYDVRYGTDYATGVSIGKFKGTALQTRASWTGARTFWVAAIDSQDSTGAAGSVVATVTAPGAPSVTATFAGENFALSWGAIQGTMPTDYYEIRHGASFADGTTVGTIKGTTYSAKVSWTGARTFWVAALDSNATTGTAGSATATVNLAAAPTVAAAFSGPNVVVTWNAVQGTLPTDFYEVRFGASFGAGTSLGTIKGTSFSAKAQWSGARTFWVAATDINGNVGTAGSQAATVAVPATVTITQEVIDNNVLLKWGDATATLPIDYYELRKGATWAGGTVIGRIASRFSAIFESTAGSYTYWVAATDVAGNMGGTSNVAALVNQPPDYALQYNQDSAFGGTLTNVAIDVDGSRLAPVSTTETWQDHFTTRSWASPQAQVTAGYPIFAQPSQATGSYEETVDYGTVLAATKITATLTYNVVSGTPVVTPTISTKKLIGDAWTDYAGLASVYVSDFRYVKVRYDFGSTGGDDLLDITGLNIRFDVKLKNDAGTLAVFPSQAATYSQTGTTITATFTAHGRVTGQRVDMDFTTGTAPDGEYVITSHTANTFTVTSAVSTTTSGNVTLDPSGSPALFNVTFVDVQSITVSPAGTTASLAIYNFVDSPNPTGFKGLLYNTAGTRIAGTVGWAAKGV